MTDVNTADELKKQLDTLGEIEGDVPAEQVRAFVALVRSFFAGQYGVGDEEIDPELYGELGDLAHFINGARKELSDINPGDLKNEKLPEASDQLDAVIKTTEAATHKIIDSCGQLQGALERITERLQMADPAIDPDTLASVDDAVLDVNSHITNILEACNFQDLTGQRIMKIVEVLREIERQVFRMVIVFGLRGKNDKLDEASIKELEDDAKLLNGPAMEGEGLDQDDIDDILAKLL